MDERLGGRAAVTPFMQFRIWYRRAPGGQRAAAAVAVAALAALVIWSAVPSSNGSSTVLAVGEAGGPSATGAPKAAAPGAPGGSAGASGVSGATGGSGASGPGAVSGSAGGTVSGAATDQGSSASASPSASTPSATAAPTGTGQTCTKMGTLKIGVVVPEGAGGSLNTVIGNPQTSEEEADYAAVLDDVNKAGGVDCYNLVGDFAASDLTNPSSARSGCLQFVQDKVFAVLGGFEPLFSDDCTLQAHIPTFDELAIPDGSAHQHYPYYFSTYPTYQRLYKNFVDAVNQMGYFGAGKHFTKLGIFYQDCTPEILQALLADLASVGVSGAKVDTFDLGCTSLAPPSAVEQGVLKFKTDGVTTATTSDDLADGQTISNTANSQGWKPAWILPDYGELAVQNSSSEHPNAANFDGAVAVTAGQYGAVPAHIPETPGTQRCDQIMTSHHLPTVYQSGDQFAGSTCSLVWMLVAAMQHAGVNQAALPGGLQAAKTVETSFPNGPNDFSAPGTVTGGEFWREDIYHAACQCWQTVNPNWNPSF